MKKIIPIPLAAALLLPVFPALAATPRIHDATVIDADFGYSGGKEVSGSIRLQAGLHPFQLYYVNRSKKTLSLKFSWSGPGIPKEAIPNNVFRHAAGS
jgi:hypothetical protein